MKNTPFTPEKTKAVVMLGIFYFVFLGAEYLFDNTMTSHVTSHHVVLMQGCILGISAVGFPCGAWLYRLLSARGLNIPIITGTALGIICIFILQQHLSFAASIISGLLLFFLLGISGSWVHYAAAATLCGDSHLARAVGAAYALGIALQFINNNIIPLDIAETGMLALFLAVMSWMLHRFKDPTKDPAAETSDTQAPAADTPTGSDPAVSLSHDPGIRTAALLFVLMVALMTFIFAALDNAVTFAHASGAADIGQWPRLLLALSGLAAGYLFDIRDRSYMHIMMYCVMLLSAICAVMIETGGPFTVALVIFYLSAGFFAVFFTTGFLALSVRLENTPLWAGMGRTVNNACAVVAGILSAALFDTGSDLVIMSLTLVLFAVISIVIYLYLTKYEISHQHAETTSPIPMPKPEPPAREIPSEEELLTAFCREFALTDREKDVLCTLINSEESAQKIAEELGISRAALYRHIASLNEKTGTGSRIGLMQFFFSWEKDRYIM